MNKFIKKLIFSLLISCFSLKTGEEVHEVYENFIVIALGESCGVTAALEVFDLKKASYPFEWCISNFEPLYNSLKNDFLDFTNPAYFTPYIDNRSPVNKYGIVLAHDFPIVSAGLNSAGQEYFVLDPNWPSFLPAVQQKYQRRIDRFHAACRSGKKIYFVRHLEIMEDNAALLSRLLSELYPDLDFTLICVRLCPPHLGIWDVPRVKNYYVDPLAPGGEVNEWKRIFIDAGIIAPHKNWNDEQLAQRYKNHLCGNCSYCRKFFNNP